MTLSRAQPGPIEAIYHGAQNEPYKIDLKYFDQDTVVYVSHYKSGSVCLKQHTSRSEDTLIVEEAYFDVHYPVTIAEKLLTSDTWMISKNPAGDTIMIYLYHWMDMDKCIGDTMITGTDALNGSYQEKIEKYNRIEDILNNKRVPLIDSLEHRETRKSYFLNGIPVKVEAFTASRKKQVTRLCASSENALLCKSCFHRDTLEWYRTDSISWNSDTTQIRWSLNRWDWQKRFYWQYLVTDEKLEAHSSDNRTSYRQFLRKENPLLPVLTSELVYSDPLYVIELAEFDRQKKTRVMDTVGTEMEYSYCWDVHGRIYKQTVHRDQKLFKYITYRYE